MAGKTKKKKEVLRPDTTLTPVGEPEAEIYVGGLPACCLRTFKEAVVEGGDRRLLELQCSCERNWRITSSLDDRVLRRFVTLKRSAISSQLSARLQEEKAGG